jgi:hypothetical protein
MLAIVFIGNLMYIVRTLLSNHMKKFLGLILFLSAGNMTFAQQYSTKDTTKEQILVSSVNNERSTGNYQGIVEIGYAFGVGEWGMNNIKLNIINSKRFNQFFSFGLGIGLRRKYEKSKFYEIRKWPSIGSNNLYPIFLDFRTNLSNKKVSPYFALGIGGYFGVYGLWAGTKGGFFLNPSTGIKLKVSNKSAILASIVYEMQSMEFWYEPTATNSQEIVGSLGINIGFSF